MVLLLVENQSIKNIRDNDYDDRQCTIICCLNFSQKKREKHYFGSTFSKE
jgi:hypothetical protein